MNNEESTYNLDVNTAISLSNAAQQLDTPFAIYKPKLYPDGDKWCALYGDNIQKGVAAFGDTPNQAVKAFNDAWYGLDK